MSFSQLDQINKTFNAFLASIASSAGASWYESKFILEYASEAEMVLNQIDVNTLKGFPASTPAQAVTNAAINSTLVEDRSDVSAALRLTEVPGTNGQVYAAYSTYNDLTSTRYKKFLKPWLIPKTDGTPSNGYSIRLWEGDPDSGGIEVKTTDGVTGTGEDKKVAWIWNYDSGILLISEDFVSNITNPYITFFRYIGKTAADLTGTGLANIEITASATITIDSVALNLSRFNKWMITIADDPVTPVDMESFEVHGFCYDSNAYHSISGILNKSFKKNVDVNNTGILTELKITNNETFSIYVSFSRLHSV